MGFERISLLASGLVVGLLLSPSGVRADDAAASPSFEVMVLRGAGVVRVSGTPDGGIREETLREDPRPVRRTRAPRRRAETSGEPIVVVIHNEYRENRPALAYFPFFGQHRYAHERYLQRSGHGHRDAHARSFGSQHRNRKAPVHRAPPFGPPSRHAHARPHGPAASAPGRR